VSVTTTSLSTGIKVFKQRANGDSSHWRLYMPVLTAMGVQPARRTIIERRSIMLALMPGLFGARCVFVHVVGAFCHVQKKGGLGGGK
jgi:hypothetical protein